MPPGVLVFEDLQDTILGSATGNRFIIEDPSENFVVFDADRRINDQTDDAATDFVVFDSPIPKTESVDAPQDFLLIDSPNSLTVQMDDGDTDFVVIYGSAGPMGSPGPEGPEGPAGADGENVPYFQTFSFASASTLWTIVHSQDTYRLVVELFDPGGVPLEAEITYVDTNTITVSWYYATAGFARVFN